MRKLILSLLVAASLAACDKEELPEKAGILQSLVLDGCTHVILLEDGTRLEPVANSSGVELLHNKPFMVRYRGKPTTSICMVGQTVEIVSLRYL